ncbi:hypothetical protein Aperf_G00000093988 [Anoplocephala perfoliata]
MHRMKKEEGLEGRNPEVKETPEKKLKPGDAMVETRSADIEKMKYQIASKSPKLFEEKKLEELQKVGTKMNAQEKMEQKKKSKEDSAMDIIGDAFRDETAENPDDETPKNVAEVEKIEDFAKEKTTESAEMEKMEGSASKILGDVIKSTTEEDRMTVKEKSVFSAFIEKIKTMAEGKKSKHLLIDGPKNGTELGNLTSPNIEKAKYGYKVEKTEDIAIKEAESTAELKGEKLFAELEGEDFASSVEMPENSEELEEPTEITISANEVLAKHEKSLVVVKVENTTEVKATEDPSCMEVKDGAALKKAEYNVPENLTGATRVLVKESVGELNEVEKIEGLEFSDDDSDSFSIILFENDPMVETKDDSVLEKDGDDAAMVNKEVSFLKNGKESKERKSEDIAMKSECPSPKPFKVAIEMRACENLPEWTAIKIKKTEDSFIESVKGTLKEKDVEDPALEEFIDMTEIKKTEDPESFKDMTEGRNTEEKRKDRSEETKADCSATQSFEDKAETKKDEDPVEAKGKDGSYSIKAENHMIESFGHIAAINIDEDHIEENENCSFNDAIEEKDRSSIEEKKDAYCIMENFEDTTEAKNVPKGVVEKAKESLESNKAEGPAMATLEEKAEEKNVKDYNGQEDNDRSEDSKIGITIMASSEDAAEVKFAEEPDVKKDMEGIEEKKNEDPPTGTSGDISEKETFEDAIEEKDQECSELIKTDYPVFEDFEETAEVQTVEDLIEEIGENLSEINKTEGPAMVIFEEGNETKNIDGPNTETDLKSIGEKKVENPVRGSFEGNVELKRVEDPFMIGAMNKSGINKSENPLMETFEDSAGFKTVNDPKEEKDNGNSEENQSESPIMGIFKDIIEFMLIEEPIEEKNMDGLEGKKESPEEESGKKSLETEDPVRKCIEDTAEMRYEKDSFPAKALYVVETKKSDNRTPKNNKGVFGSKGTSPFGSVQTKNKNIPFSRRRHRPSKSRRNRRRLHHRNRRAAIHQRNLGYGV